MIYFTKDYHILPLTGLNAFVFVFMLLQEKAQQQVLSASSPFQALKNTKEKSTKFKIRDKTFTFIMIYPLVQL